MGLRSELYGQWMHDYPDRPEGHDGGIDSLVSTLGSDDLLEWFDYYLRDMGLNRDYC